MSSPSYHHEVERTPLGEVNRERCSGDPLMCCPSPPLPRAAKPVWAKQLTRLPFNLRRTNIVTVCILGHGGE